MIELRKLDTGLCRLFGKCEFMNPAGSIKDRIAISMITAAEADGRLDPKGDPPPTIIEATAGNTGLGLALVAGQKGYKLKVVVPDKMSQEKIQHLLAMGAEVVLARSDVTKGHPEYYQEVAAAIAAKTPNSLYINQFGNEDNSKAHYDTTAPEVWEQLGGKIESSRLGDSSVIGTLVETIGTEIVKTVKQISDLESDLHMAATGVESSFREIDSLNRAVDSFIELTQNKEDKTRSSSSRVAA